MSESWRPSCDFEDEMMAIQPDFDLIFQEHGKNPESLAAPVLEDECQKLFGDNGESSHMSTGKNKELHLVGKIRKMIPGKNCVGRRLTEDDLENDADREVETVAMIRNVGSAQCVDVPLASKDTLPTISTKESYKISNGHVVLYDPEYFKLKPRNSSSEASTSKSLDISSSTGETSSISTMFKTFTLMDSDDSKSQCNSLNGQSVAENLITTSSPEILSKTPSVPKGEAKKKTRVILWKQGLIPEDLCRVDIQNNNGEKWKCKVKHENFITPKELYMRKRAAKS